jgi:hypothetical protein
MRFAPQRTHLAAEALRRALVRVRVQARVPGLLRPAEVGLWAVRLEVWLLARVVREPRAPSETSRVVDPSGLKASGR